jgi:Helix-turn-helix domain
MVRRYPNPRLAKLHRSYSTKELADLCGKHPNTIRNWQADGLEGFRDGRQCIFPGVEVRRFLEEKRTAGKRSCPAGMLFCFKCREPRSPAFDEVELATGANGRRMLTGLCSVCSSVMTQAVSAERLGAFRKIVNVTAKMTEQPLLEEPNAVDDCG